LPSKPTISFSDFNKSASALFAAELLVLLDVDVVFFAEEMADDTVPEIADGALLATGFAVVLGVALGVAIIHQIQTT
jgi:hypothetical protein